MEKKNFVSLLMGTVGVLLFGIGMCMCMLPQWNAFNQGVVTGVIGAVVLLALVAVRRRMSGKPRIQVTGKAIAAVLLAVAGALVLGTGMCMTMVWEGLMLPGIIVGMVGIVLLLCLIPLCKGLK